MKNRIEKTKVWIKDHQEGIAAASVMGAVVAFYGACAYVVVKSYNAQSKEAEAQRQTLTDAVARGDSILPGPNGMWWVIDQKAA